MKCDQMNLCSKWTNQISCFSVSSYKCETFKEKCHSVVLLLYYGPVIRLTSCKIHNDTV